MFVGQFQDGCCLVKRVHQRFKHIHPMVNHFYNQLITQVKTTLDNVSSLSDFVPEVPSSRCQHQHPMDKSLVLSRAATISSELSQAARLA